MRAAFEESVRESEEARRSHRHSRRLRPKHHRLQKLMAQIAFGLYLLHDSLAKSDSAVVRILQGHINEMDEFLAATTASFEVGGRDVASRTEYLDVPIDETGQIAFAFDEMMRSRDFRADVMARNERVTVTVQRMSRSLQSSLRDIKEALSAVDELAKYLLDLKDGWRKTNLVRVYSAMRHNAAMWFRCCVGLQMKAARLGERINRLQGLVLEIEQRTGSASRRYATQPGPSTLRFDKPLPQPPRPAPAVPAIDIQIPYRTSSRPNRRLSKARSKSSPHVSTPTLGPSGGSRRSTDAAGVGPKRSISMRFKQSIMRSKSMVDLKRDKGKQRETLPAMNGGVAAPTARSGEEAVKRQRSRLLRVTFSWTSPLSPPRKDRVSQEYGSPHFSRVSRTSAGTTPTTPLSSRKSGPGSGAGSLLRRIGTMVFRRNRPPNVGSNPTVPARVQTGPF